MQPSWTKLRELLHMALIAGHQPAIITELGEEAFDEAFGQIKFPALLEILGQRSNTRFSVPSWTQRWKRQWQV